MQQKTTELWFSAEYWLFQIGDEYWSFKIGDERNDKYRLEVSGYSGDAGDSLQYEGDWNGNERLGEYYHNGMKFSTFDQDNDLSIANCAYHVLGGWWHNSCFYACLTCRQSNTSWKTLQPFEEAFVINSRMMTNPQ